MLAGNNTYGQLGNGTRNNETEYTLVGDRDFKIEPKTKTMKVGDTEEIKVSGNPFNVFNSKKWE